MNTSKANGFAPDDALDWIAALFQESRSAIAPDTLRENIPSWDSLGVLTLMAELDEKFDIIVSDEDMRQMTKIDDILGVLRQHGKLAS